MCQILSKSAINLRLQLFELAFPARRLREAKEALEEELERLEDPRITPGYGAKVAAAAGTAKKWDEQEAAAKVLAAEPGRRPAEEEAAALKEALLQAKKEVEAKGKEVAAAEAARKRAEEEAASAKESLKEALAKAKEHFDALKAAEERIRQLEKDKQELQACINSFSLARSTFKVLYSKAQTPKDDLELLRSLQLFIEQYCRHKKLAQEIANKFYKALRREAQESSAAALDEMLDNVPLYAQRLWTSVALLEDGGNGIELCSAINDSIRLDKPELLEPLVVVVRAINQLCVPNRGTISDTRWPTDGRCFRGTVLPDEHKAFFSLGNKYRVPGYLATSFDERVALRFASEAYRRAKGGLPAALWIVQVDPAGGTDPHRRCAQVNYVTSSNLGDAEQEFLFAPYSTFTVTRVEWSPSPNNTRPHRIYLEAALDNQKEPEDLPLAPWY